MAEGVAQQLRQQPFAAHPRAGGRERAHQRSMPAPGQFAHDRERQQLRLQQGRRQQQHQHPAGAAEAAEFADRGPEPGEPGGGEGDCQREPAQQRAAEAGAGIKGEQPRHQRDETEQVAVATARVQPKQQRAGQHARRQPPAGAQGSKQAQGGESGSCGGGMRICRIGRPGGACCGGTTRSAGIASGWPAASTNS